jgi:hypothetical protein
MKSRTRSRKTGLDRIKPRIEKADRNLAVRTQNRQLRAITGHGVVSTGAQRRNRLGFSTRRLRHLQFQPHSGRHPGFRAFDTANQRKHYVEEEVGAAVRTAIAWGTVTQEDLFFKQNLHISAARITASDTILIAISPRRCASLSPANLQHDCRQHMGLLSRSNPIQKRSGLLTLAIADTGYTPMTCRLALLLVSGNQQRRREAVLRP